MDKIIYPMLYRSSFSLKLHILDKLGRARCGAYSLGAVPFFAPVPLADLCPDCGTLADFEAVNDLRKREQIARTVAANEIDCQQSAARPGLTSEIMQRLAELGACQKHLSVEGPLDIILASVDWKNQIYTLEIRVLNGAVVRP